MALDKLTSYKQIESDTGLYNVNAGKPVKKASSIQNVRDSIEDGAKQEALKTLNKTFFENTVGAIIVQIAKYIFIAIAWPPYALLIELPQWIFSQVTPILAKMLLVMKKTLSKQLEHLIQLAMPIVHFFQKAAQIITLPFVKLAHGLERMYKVIKNRASQLVSKMAVLVPRKGLKALVEVAQNMGVAVKKVIVKTAKAISQPFVKAAIAIKETITETIKQVMGSEIVQKIVEMPQVILGWMIVPFQQVTIQFQKAQKIAEQATKLLTKGMAKFVAPFSLVARLFYGPAVRVSTFIKSQLKRFFNFFKGKGQSFGGWVKGKAEVLHPKNWIGKLFPPFMYSWIPLFIRNAILRAFRWLMAQPATQAMLEGLKKAWAYTLQLPSKFVTKFFEIVHSIGTHSKRICSLIKGQFVRMAEGIGFIIQRTVYWTLTMGIMISIVMGLSLKLLARISISLGRFVNNQITKA